MCPPEQTIPFDVLVEALLQRAVVSGLKPPIVVVLVSVNGFVSAVRYERKAHGEWNRTLLVEGSEPKGKYPLNLIFCDSRGQSQVALVKDPSTMTTSIQ